MSRRGRVAYTATWLEPALAAGTSPVFKSLASGPDWVRCRSVGRSPMRTTRNSERRKSTTSSNPAAWTRTGAARSRGPDDLCPFGRCPDAVRSTILGLDRCNARIHREWMCKEAVMKRLDRITATLLLIAGLGSLALILLAFVVHIPLRDGSHNLVRAASGAYVEVPVAPQTYLQKYGISELLLLGLGLVLVFAVGIALRSRAVHGRAGAGGLAWGLSVACLMLGILGSVTIAPYLLLVGILLVLACSACSRNGLAPEGASRSSVTSGVAD